jgi:hypothetical protein
MRVLVASLTIAALVTLTGCASSGGGSSSEIFRLSDPRGDDHGGGNLVYPMNADLVRGDLDLVGFSALAVPGGTMFEATFAKPIKVPERRTIDGVGTSLDDVARLGFYAFNIDVYIDKDGVPESGSISTLPGRNVIVDPRNAWEKAIVVTPDPGLARTELRRLLVRAEKKKGEKGERFSEEMREQLRSDVDTFILFPERVEVHGSRIRFFVPSSFLGSSASPDWSYAVAVTGADVVLRTDQSNRFQRSGETAHSLMVLPMALGRPDDRFGGAIEDDPYPAPLVDILVPAGTTQQEALRRDGNSTLPSQIPAVRPRQD